MEQLIYLESAEVNLRLLSPYGKGGEMLSFISVLSNY